MSRGSVRSGWLSRLGQVRWPVTGKWFVLSAVVGLVAGLGAIVFQVAGQAVASIGLARIAGLVFPEAAGEYAFFAESHREFVPWLVVAVMVAGGLVSGWLVETFAPEARGHGTDAAIEAFHHKQGWIQPRIPLIKTLASAVTLGTGGSAGREGPIAQIGAGFGSILATWFGLAPRDRRILMAAGMGAGVGAIFRAPLAGALFAGEILYRDADIESDVIVPSAIASTVAYSTYALSLPSHLRFSPLFGSELQYSLATPLELVPYTLLALAVTAVGWLYVGVFYKVHALFDRLPCSAYFKPALGAFLAGLLGIGVYYMSGQQQDLLAVLGTGYGTLQRALEPGTPPAIELLLAVALLKILTTSLTISSGGSGGVFGPSIAIGGCLGTAVGLIAHTWWPDIVHHPQAYGIVGMAGFFAGCANAPFSTVLMVAEMTGSYHLLVPTLWVCTISFVLSFKWKLYKNQVPTRLDSPAHRGDFLVDVLEGILVRDVFNPRRKIRSVPEGMTLEDIVHLLAETSQRYFPVVDAQQNLVGIFSTDDVRSYLYDDTLWKVANARDVMTSQVVTVVPDDDLNTALNHFTSLNIDELPVVDPENPKRLIGTIRHKELIAAYNRRLLEHKRAVEADRL